MRRRFTMPSFFPFSLLFPLLGIILAAEDEPQIPGDGDPLIRPNAGVMIIHSG
jgi:hypothetical protein